MVKRSRIAIIASALVVLAVVAAFLLSAQTPPKQPAKAKQSLVAVAVCNDGVKLFDATTMEELNYTSSVPPVTSYALASDGKFLYVGFVDLGADPPARIWRFDGSGAYSELVLPGYTSIHKIWFTSDLFALVSNDRTNEVAILRINTTSYAVEGSVALNGLPGRPTDLEAAQDRAYMTVFNVSANLCSLVRMSATFDIAGVVSVPADSPAKVQLSEDAVFLRCSDAVLKFSTDLTLIARTPGVFGYGDLALAGDRIAVAGYKIGAGTPCVYWLNATTLEVIDVAELSTSPGSAFQVAHFDGSTFVAIWESGTGTSLVRIAADGQLSKHCVSNKVSTWPVNLLCYEIEH